VGKLVISQFVTLDGVAEDPGGSEGFERGGWALHYDRGDEGDRFKLDELMAAEALLLGRVTYEGFAAAWPSRSGEFAEKFNSMAKHVVSSTLADPDWSNSTVIEGEPAEAVRSLRDEANGDVLVNGSLELVAALAETDLVDEYRLMVFPTVLGAGRRLFGETGAALPLRLVDSMRAGETVVLTYAPGER
jgi:dihydrofolate reductase